LGGDKSGGKTSKAEGGGFESKKKEGERGPGFGREVMDNSDIRLNMRRPLWGTQDNRGEGLAATDQTNYKEKNEKCRGNKKKELNAL